VLVKRYSKKQLALDSYAHSEQMSQIKRPEPTIWLDLKSQAIRLSVGMSYFAMVIALDATEAAAAAMIAHQLSHLG
jgi:hypothetical protein